MAVPPADEAVMALVEAALEPGAADAVSRILAEARRADDKDGGGRLDALAAGASTAAAIAVVLLAEHRGTSPEALLDDPADPAPSRDLADLTRSHFAADPALTADRRLAALRAADPERHLALVAELAAFTAAALRRAADAGAHPSAAAARDDLRDLLRAWDRN